MFKSKYRRFVEELATTVLYGEPAPHWAVEYGHVNEEGDYDPHGIYGELMTDLMESVVDEARKILK